MEEGTSERNTLEKQGTPACWWKALPRGNLRAQTKGWEFPEATTSWRRGSAGGEPADVVGPAHGSSELSLQCHGVLKGYHK